MGALSGARPAAVALAASLACAAGGPPPAGVAPGGITAADSAVWWGDEHAGLVEEESDTPERPRRGAAVDIYGGDSRAVRAALESDGAAARVRATTAWTTGAVEWRGAGWLRHLAAGYLQPSVAGGALIGDPRDAGDLRAGESPVARGLDARASLSRWGTAVGVGAAVVAGSLVVSAGAWRSGRDRAQHAGAFSAERRSGRASLGVCAAASEGASTGRAASVFGALDAGDAALGGELALAAEGPRAIVRAALGGRREWRAVAEAGTRRAADAASITHERARRGASLERHDRSARVESRAALSTWTERDGDSELARRRAAWNAAWTIAPGARAEFALRLTRDETVRFEDGPLAAAPERERRDEWRLRAGLRARRDLAPGWSVENAYRIDLVGVRRGRAGTLVTWTGTVRRGAVDCTLSAASHALHDGQPAWTANPGIAGEAAFLAVSGRGTRLSAALRAALGPHARAGATWAAQGNAHARASVFLSLDI